MGAATIKIWGAGRKALGHAESVQVRHELNRIPEATVHLDTDAFKVSGSDFEPGQPIAVTVTDSLNKDYSLFSGVVVAYALESRTDAGRQVRLELKDVAVRLTRQRKSAVFRDGTDAEAIRGLIRKAELQVGAIAASTTVHDELVQFYSSDWDFIVSRADAEGLAVDVRDGEVSVQPLVSKEAPGVRLYATGEGVDLKLRVDKDRSWPEGHVIALELDFSGQAQWAELSARAWDAESQKSTVPVAGVVPSQGSKLARQADKISKELGGASGDLVLPAHTPPQELKAWASSQLTRSRLSMLRGRVEVGGRTDVVPLDMIDVSELGEQFGGAVPVSAVAHRVDTSVGWRTELEVGLAPEPFTAQTDIAALPAGGLLPPAQGLHIGVVRKFETDPRGHHRVKVHLSVLDERQEPVWARMARPDAGKDRGLVFWPEPGDEVVVGFLGGDPRQAVILGSLHGPGLAPPRIVGPPSAQNQQRAFVTPKGTAIAFDDAGPSVSIQTPAKNEIRIDDAAGTIRLADQHGNTITLDAEGITLKSAGNVVIQGKEVDVK